ncbi:MAG: GxxExxY protein, partial [Planctomycetota bacterium]|nr:GxxExxY protein [Planctomycetota bacterium]
LHRHLGPGLLESVYEEILAQRLRAIGLKVESQVHLAIEFKGLHFERGFRVDLLVENTLIIEIKSVDTLLSVHHKQLLSYLRLAGLPLGLLLNLGGCVFRENCKRVVNGYGASPAIRARRRNAS